VNVAGYRAQTDLCHPHEVRSDGQESGSDVPDFPHVLVKAAEWGYTETMQITVELPKDIAQRPDPAREALEALAIEGYRSGALTSFETRRLLGFETRYELDGFLKAHNVWEHAYNVEDFNRDCETLERLEDERSPEAERPA